MNVVSTALNSLERRLPQLCSRARSAAAVWAFRTFPSITNPALEIAAAGFEPASIPHFFSSDVRQIDPTLNDDLLELYGRAGQVLSNRFAFFNSPQSFDQGINWDPPQRPGWRVELHACDYILDLACTFRISGEEIYARQIRYLIAHWIACNPAVSGIGWQAHILARRIRNWMLAADLARGDWESDREFLDVVIKSLALQATFLHSQLDSLSTSGNKLDASRALLCASRFFAGSKAREVRQAGLDLLTGALADACAEPWPQARLAKAQTLMEWNLLSRPGDVNLLGPELRTALEELESVLMPDGCLPLLGPKARLAPDEVSDLAALAAVRFGNPTWKALAGKFGIMPYLYLGEDGKRQFDNLEAADWSPQDCVTPGAEFLRMVGPRNSALVVSVRLPASLEEHRDFMSYELTLDDHRVVVDSGCFSPDQSGGFGGPHAHNVLLVDGRELRWTPSESAVLVDHRKLPETGDRLQIGVESSGPAGFRHKRAWFRMEHNAWLILDWLDGRGIHSCTSLMHFYPTFEVVIDAPGAVARSRAVSFSVTPVGSRAPLLSVSRGEHPQFASWYSPEFGVKFPMTVLAFDWKNVELPWMGGTIITNSADCAWTQVEVDPRERRVNLQGPGGIYRLQIR